MRVGPRGVAAVVVAVLGLVALGWPAGPTAAGSADYRHEVPPGPEGRARCVHLTFSGTLTWTERRGLLVTRYTDLEARDSRVDLRTDAACLAVEGPITSGRLHQTWPVECSELCPGMSGADSWRLEPPPPGEGITEGSDVMDVGLAPSRSWAASRLCVPVGVGADLEELGGHLVRDYVGATVDVCTG